jgi:OmpA-OmpF porin, OOP family
MRSGVGAILSILALAVELFAFPAKATDCGGALSTCIDDDVLWPHAGPAHFVAVGSAETTGAGHLGFGLVTSYLSRPIVLQSPSPGPGHGTSYNAVDDQVNSSFLWSYGVTRDLELDLALPLTLGQGGTGLAPVTGGAGLKDTAARDLRFGVAYAILAHDPIALDAASRGAQGLVARFEMSAPTGDRSQFAGEHSAIFAPGVSGDYRFGPIFVGAEVGARIRPTTQLLDARIGSQFVGALGIGYDILPRELLAVALEAWALPTYVTPAEWQVSLRSSPLRAGDLSLQLGGGAGIPFGGDLPLTTPRFRFTFGVRWAPL